MDSDIKNRQDDMEELSQEDLMKLKKILNDFLDELLYQAGSAVSELSRETAREIEEIDSASVNINQSVNLHLHSRKSRLIKKIYAALQRMEDGTYGYCETCGECISVKRLFARPVTSKCLLCKEAEERMESVSS